MEMETQAGRGDGDTGYYQRPGAKPGGLRSKVELKGFFFVVVFLAYFMSIPRKIKSREMLILLCCCTLEKDTCK